MNTFLIALLFIALMTLVVLRRRKTSLPVERKLAVTERARRPEFSAASYDRELAELLAEVNKPVRRWSGHTSEVA